LALASKEIFAQEKHVHNLEQIWTGYFHQSRLSNKWEIGFDAQLRTKDAFFKGLSLTVIRPGIGYYINDNVRLGTGYAYFTYYPQDNFKLARPEHRLWQQVQWYSQSKQNKTRQYIRLEERWRRKIGRDSTLASGYNFNYRIRYSFFWQLPLIRKTNSEGNLSFILSDEIHVNFGKEVVYNYFDQNRFFAGFAYNTSTSNYVQFGYLNVFQQLNSGSNYKSINAARIVYFHNLDWRKKKLSL